MNVTVKILKLKNDGIIERFDRSISELNNGRLIIDMGNEMVRISECKDGGIKTYFMNKGEFETWAKMRFSSETFTINEEIFSGTILKIKRTYNKERIIAEESWFFMPRHEGIFKSKGIRGFKDEEQFLYPDMIFKVTYKNNVTDIYPYISLDPSLYHKSLLFNSIVMKEKYNNNINKIQLLPCAFPNIYNGEYLCYNEKNKKPPYNILWIMKVFEFSTFNTDLINDRKYRIINILKNRKLKEYKNVIKEIKRVIGA